MTTEAAKKLSRVTMDMAAMAASPKAPAATLRKIVERLWVPWRTREGAPPATISFAMGQEGWMFPSRMGMFPPRQVMANRMQKLTNWLKMVA